MFLVFKLMMPIYLLKLIFVEDENEKASIIIADQLAWDPHVEYLNTKLNNSIVKIKRVKPFIPKSEYMELNNS